MLELMTLTDPKADWFAKAYALRDAGVIDDRRLRRLLDRGDEAAGEVLEAVAVHLGMVAASGYGRGLIDPRRVAP